MNLKWGVENECKNTETENSVRFTNVYVLYVLLLKSA